MKKNYQTKTPAAMIVPDSVANAMTDLAEELREGLLALAVGTGLQVMGVLLEESVTALGWWSPCCPSDLAVARTPTRRQASGGGPPPQIPRRTGQPPRRTTGVFRKMSVLSNGRTVAKLRGGERQVIDIEPGTYTIRARMDWISSREIQVLISDSQVVFLEFSMPLQSIVRMLYQARSAIVVESLMT
jgi:hypothetical protein